MAKKVANNDETIKKVRNYGFQKGKSGNPSGRPSLDEEFKNMLKVATPKALENLIRIAEDEKTPIREKLRAIEYLVDRRYGKSTQGIDLNANIQSDIQAKIDLSGLSLNELKKIAGI